MGKRGRGEVDCVCGKMGKSEVKGFEQRVFLQYFRDDLSSINAEAVACEIKKACEFFCDVRVRCVRIFHSD